MAGRVTPTNVCGDVKPIAETEAVPSPDKSRVPTPGALVKVTVISAVKVSSLILSGVRLSLQTDSLEELIALILHASTLTLKVA